jgi:hypothetical protein
MGEVDRASISSRETEGAEGHSLCNGQSAIVANYLELGFCDWSDKHRECCCRIFAPENAVFDSSFSPRGAASDSVTPRWPKAG